MPRSTLALLVLALTTATSGCFLERAGSRGGAVDAGGFDAATTDTGPGMLDAATTDAAATDAATTDAATTDAGPPDAGPPDAGPPDAGPPDAGPPCVEMTHAAVACAASHTDITNCDRLYDGLETNPICPTRSEMTLDCGGTSATYCDYSGSCPDTDGCIEDVWIQLDLGAAVSVGEARFLAGWWRDRPDNFEIWHSNSSTDVPDSGATMIFSGNSDTAPWACVTGEACTDEVPDGCCRDGRSSPQITDQSAYTPACNLGDFFPKFNAATFTDTVARYWYLVVRDGDYRDRVYLNELEFRRSCAP